ncbi:hypothetical protein JKG68_30370 [Microvirga aerilata]|uniref:BZIP domain-containing protein n=1 Tax=Microvirga aerilata TaxID=670292 RepID=A0A937D0Y3_9HYPH|nr:hypothetical protein [Microvirga aerilata]MBL0408194.1 hypothetical protein [Microvirga aerilata]
MVSAFNAKLAVYGQWTYRVAWALEIVAASIGLATGIALGYQAYSASLSTELSVSGLDLALASAPFFMVALAELTKIPIATLLFSVRWIWKPFLAIALCLLALITFETVFLGLERASTQRQIQYEEIQSRKHAAQIDLQNTDKSLASLAAASHVADVKAEVDRLNEMEASEVQRKQGEIQQLQSQVENLKMQNPPYASLARQIAAKDAEFKQLMERRDSEIRVQLEPFERQRDSFTKRIEAAREKSDLATVRRLEEELARLRNPLPAIRERFNIEEQRLQGDLRGLREQQTALENSETEGEKLARSRLVERQNLLEQELRDLRQAWQDRRNRTLSQLQDAQQKAAQNGAQADRLRTKVSQLQNELTVLEKERVVTSRNDQIRRLAGRFYGKNPEAVSVEEAGFISVVWFGSLGALAAFAGPLTAIVALGLQRSAEVRETKGTRTLSDYLRRWLIRWRFKRTRKVQVPVEVTIEKEVEKRVEVPVEKIIKEVLYIPILTDDPEAVRRSLQQDLPTDIADLVRVNFKGVPNASAA